MGKKVSKKVLITAIIVALLFAVGCIWYIVTEIFEEASEARSTYSSSVNESGQIVYTKVDEEGEPVTDENGDPITFTIEELAEAQKGTLKSYIPGDDETYSETIKYLIEAESVTTMPYIDGKTEDELNGQIKFYRYTDSEDVVNGEEIKEENRLTYMPLEEFNAKMEAYETNPTNNKDIFKHFTIDEEGTVLIAYGSEEHRYVETGIDGGKTDFELTEEVVNNATSGSGTYSGNANSKFQMHVYTINTKPVDYLSLVEQYIMPTNLLYSLLVASGDIDFVMEVANLAYQNEIAIGIYDNQNYRTTTELYEYKKAMNIELETKFEYKDVLVSINGSNLLTEAELRRSPYTNIIDRCLSKTVNHKISHNVAYKAEGLIGWSEVEPSIQMLVDGEDSIGEITNLGEGQTYKTKYTKTIDAMSTPTVGILLADTWIAKWEVTYTKKVDPLPESSGGIAIDDTITASYESADINSSEIFAEFASNFDNTIKEKASEHADGLKAETIERIIEQTPDSKFEVAAETATLTLEEKKDLLYNHVKVNRCSTCAWCLSIISVNPDNLTKDELYTTLTDSNLQSRMPPYFSTNMTTHIQGIFDAALREKQREANNDAATSENAKREAFENKLNEEGTITYSQTIAGSKEYINIINKYSSSGESTKYEKSETVSRTEECEKFKEIFNKTQYYDAKQAILRRESWFWEFVRANEDTAKLEDILRYMLNIATGTEKFGTFDDLDSLFAAFIPKEEFISAAKSCIGLAKYLAQFSGDKPVEINGNEYFVFYNDSAGNPTIGSGDVQWLSNHDKFNMIGTVIQGDTVYEDCNVEETVNNLLGGYAVNWGEWEPSEEEKIYVDAKTVYTATDELQAIFWDEVVEHTAGLNLSRQQLYALTYIKHATGNLTYVAISENNSIERTFRSVYEEAEESGLEPNSPEFNEYIWENWWSTKWAGGYAKGREYSGWLKGRDASFETYIKGTYYFDGESVDTHIQNNGYKFYSKEEVVNKIGFSSSSVPASYARNRNINDETMEEDIFTQVVSLGVYEEVNSQDVYGIYTSTSGKSYTEWKQTTSSTWGSKVITAWNDTMARTGCGLYTSTMLLNSVGLDVNPGEFCDIYNKNPSWKASLQYFLDQNNINEIATNITSYNDYIEILSRGEGVMTYVSSGSMYTSNKHWILIADIRASELGSSYGYDVYVLSSTHRSRSYIWMG